MTWPELLDCPFWNGAERRSPASMRLPGQPRFDSEMEAVRRQQAAEDDEAASAAATVNKDGAISWWDALALRGANLSEYELQRMRRIEANKTQMQILGIEALDRPPSAQKRKRQHAPKASAPVEKQRRSARIAEDVQEKLERAITAEFKKRHNDREPTEQEKDELREAMLEEPSTAPAFKKLYLDAAQLLRSASLSARWWPGLGAGRALSSLSAHLGAQARRRTPGCDADPLHASSGRVYIVQITLDYFRS